MLFIFLILLLLLSYLLLLGFLDEEFPEITLILSDLLSI